MTRSNEPNYYLCNMYFEGVTSSLAQSELFLVRLITIAPPMGEIGGMRCGVSALGEQDIGGGKRGNELGTANCRCDADTARVWMPSGEVESARKKPVPRFCPWNGPAP